MSQDKSGGGGGAGAMGSAVPNAGGGGLGPAGSGSVSCSGTITANVVWIPDYAGEPTPKKVLIKETCYADWSGVSGGCDNALGFEEYVDPVLEEFGICVGTKWTLKDAPGATFSVTCAPVAAASLPASEIPNAGGLLSASAHVSYGVSVTVVDIALSGGYSTGTNAYKRKYLVGQLCGASVSTSPLTINTSDPMKAAQWQASGGVPFKDFDTSATSNPFTAFDSSVEHASTLSVYFAAAATPSLTFTCHLDVPSGDLPSEGIDLSLATGDRITTKSPTATGSGLLGTPAIATNYNGTYISPASCGSAGADGYQASLSVTGVTGDADIPTSQGKVNYLQVINSSTISRIRSSITEYYQVSKGVTPSNQLDASFPYPFSSNPNTPVTTSSSSTVAVDTPYTYVDAANVTSLSRHDSFSMYLMYLPPLSGSKYVPLTKYDWSWGGTITLSGGAWGPTGPVGTPATLPFNSTTTHPNWIGKLGANYGSWFAQ